jgi:adenosylcobinamide-phosphate synthase
LTLLALVIAVAMDVALGEYPEFAHPTVWFGRFVGAAERWLNAGTDGARLMKGAAALSTLAAFALLLSFVPLLLPYPLSLALHVYLLKSTFSIRALVEHVRRCATGDIREAVSRIVSRDVAHLSEPQLVSAAVESGAENLVDALIAPLFFYVLLGLPGAMVYRAVNTADAMVGYRSERYRYFGKAAARADDLLNFIPARLSLLLFLPLRPRGVLRSMRYRRVKLNGGYPMAAAHGLTGILIEKPGHYTMPGRPGTREDIRRFSRYLVVLCAETVLAAIAALWLNGGEPLCTAVQGLASTI